MHESAAHVLAPLVEMGNLMVRFIACIDARPVSEAIKPGDKSKHPSEEGLVILAQPIREHLQARRINLLFWVDTRAMLAGGLNNRGLDRKPLQTTMSQCLWTLSHEYVHIGSGTRVAATPSRSSERTPDDCVPLTRTDLAPVRSLRLPH